MQSSLGLAHPVGDASGLGRSGTVRGPSEARIGRQTGVRVELPTFRSSGLRITVQDWPQVGSTVSCCNLMPSLAIARSEALLPTCAMLTIRSRPQRSDRDPGRPLANTPWQAYHVAYLRQRKRPARALALLRLYTTEGGDDWITGRSVVVPFGLT